MHSILKVIARTKSGHCEDCVLLLTDKESQNLPVPEFDQENSDDSVKLFVDALNRGGLKYPSLMVFATCVKAWQVFKQLKQSETLMNRFLSVQQQKQCFQLIVQRVLEAEIEGVYTILPCENGHAFGARVINSFFNCLMKNHVKGLNIQHELSRKRKSAFISHSKIAMKAAKLSSQSKSSLK